jgi:hypothetical protein
MPVSQHLALPFLEAGQAQKHVTHNEALRMLDALVHLNVLDIAASPPGSPEEGARYIVGDPATDAFAEKENQVAVLEDGAWRFLMPQAGWIAFVEAANELRIYDGEAWQSPGFRILQNVDLLGIGTSADESNPLSAKLNNALFAARYAGEGGDGDLRYILNKESAANVLSLLMQSGWSGRAEIGLVGDDDLCIKVSPDGTIWKEALRIANNTAQISSGFGARVAVSGGIALELDQEVPDGGGSSILFQATRYANSAAAPVFFGRKARGTRAAPAAVQAGDTLIGFRGHGHTGSAFLTSSQGAAFLLEAAENFVHGTNYGTQIRFFTTPNGTTSSAERLRIADNGDLQMGGANTVIDASRHPVLRAYTVAALPSAAPAGRLIYVSDGSSNRRLAVSDGTNWRFPDGAVVS